MVKKEIAEVDTMAMREKKRLQKSTVMMKGKGQTCISRCLRTRKIGTTGSRIRITAFSDGVLRVYKWIYPSSACDCRKSVC
jgi:hypothetical protein